jgi:hypothetical protein
MRNNAITTGLRNYAITRGIGRRPRTGSKKKTPGIGSNLSELLPPPLPPSVHLSDSF